MDQYAAGSERETGGDRKEDPAGAPDDDGGRDRKHGGIPLVGAIEPYDRTTDPRGWRVRALGPGTGECVKKMKALVCIRPGVLEYQDIAAPIAHPGQAIIKIRRIGICGTDL